jgi:hypothetical protein
LICSPLVVAMGCLPFLAEPMNVLARNRLKLYQVDARRRTATGAPYKTTALT